MLKITKVLDLTAVGEPDVLLVRAVDEDGETYEARGWVSATTSHYDPSAYSEDADGQLVRDPDATSRAMTPPEVGEYALALLTAAFPGEFPQPDPAPEPTPIAWTAA